MPAIGDITFTDDLSPAAMYPQLDAGKIATINADLEKYGSRAYPYDYYYMAAAPKIGFRGSTEANAVRDSGKVSINQAGAWNSCGLHREQCGYDFEDLSDSGAPAFRYCDPIRCRLRGDDLLHCLYACGRDQGLRGLPGQHLDSCHP